MDALTALLSSDDLYRAYDVLFRSVSAWPPGWAVGLAILLPSLLLLIESLAAPAGARRWRRIPLGATIHAGVAAAAFAASGPALALYAALVWAVARLLGPSWRLGRHGLLRALPVLLGLSTTAIAILLLLPVGFHLLILSHETLQMPTTAEAADRLRTLLP